MKLENIFEARRNPTINVKQSAYEYLKQYKDRDDIYIHTNNVDKVGINTRYSDSHDSPNGIYAFKLKDIWKDSIERWNSGDYAKKPRGLSHLPYSGGDNIFILKSKEKPVTLENYTNSDLEKDIKQLKIMFKLDDDDIKKLKLAARTNLNFVDSSIGYLWGITKAIAAGYVSEFDGYMRTDTKKWGFILRKLGHELFHDIGHGWIHAAELGQTLFLSTKPFKVIDLFKERKKKYVKYGGNVYQSAPKRINMTSFDNVFFYNHDAKQFSNVLEWNVEHASVDDVLRLSKLLPYKGKAVIDTLVVSGFKYLGVVGVIKQLIKATTIRRIKIKKIVIDSGDGMDIESFLIKLPSNLNVDIIEYNEYVTASWALDDIAEKVDSDIKDKLKPIIPSYLKNKK